MYLYPEPRNGDLVVRIEIASLLHRASDADEGSLEHACIFNSSIYQG
jgi:hypothetical protein